MMGPLGSESASSQLAAGHPVQSRHSFLVPASYLCLSLSGSLWGAAVESPAPPPHSSWTICLQNNNSNNNPKTNRKENQTSPPVDLHGFSNALLMLLHFCPDLQWRSATAFRGREEAEIQVLMECMQLYIQIKECQVFLLHLTITPFFFFWKQQTCLHLKAPLLNEMYLINCYYLSSSLVTYTIKRKDRVG